MSDPRAGDMVNIIHIVPRISANANDVPLWYGVYELPLDVPAPDDVVRTLFHPHRWSWS